MVNSLISDTQMLMMVFAATILGFINAHGVGSKDLFRCQQSCYQKFVQDWHHCMDFDDCKSCWNNCDQQLGPFPLNVNSAMREGSLVLTDIAWDQAVTNASKQCLVTWEVSGGGLMGNLLTDSSTVELSLWPDTVYHVQVTCKHKETGGMRRSFKLIVDTHKLTDKSASSLQAIAIENAGMKSLPNIFAQETSSGETDSRMRILKDSSKDFISTYNPSVNNVEKTPSSSQKTGSMSSSSSSSSTSRSSSYIENESSTSVHMSTVLRTKLTSSTVPGVISADFLAQSIVFGVALAAVFFIGLFLLYVLTRPVRKDVPVDKVNLIHNEATCEQVVSTATASNRTLHV
ncbi:transmembrane protein fend-like isoform X2 [Eupeodes corollae]|uniref:transmembrane protein fend-like isoform X2 n=1 Tax=Eupeodes corollae TaxID=290404 RepID=UPI002493271E|nr:transmembrane protein fend-like isoform X2 [Eupeodes corollae]